MVRSEYRTQLMRHMNLSVMGLPGRQAMQAGSLWQVSKPCSITEASGPAEHQNWYRRDRDELAQLTHNHPHYPGTFSSNTS